MDLFLFQLVIIFIPGIIWERIDAKYGKDRSKQQWEIVRRSFMFGLFAYFITYLAFAGFGQDFKLFDLQKDKAFLDRESFEEILDASGISIICAVVWLYAVNFKWLTWVLHKIRATKRYGDEDVWDFIFNSGRAEVEYLNLRDFEKQITYAGFVKSFSESEKQREIVLRDVIVYDFTGRIIFETPRVYIARKADDIDIEFPYQPPAGANA